MASILPVASRNAFKRSVGRIGAPTMAVVPQRYSSTMHDNDPDVGSHPYFTWYVR